MVYNEAILSLVNIPTIVLLFILFIFSLRLLKPNKLPPGPRGWPIIGSIPHIDEESYLTFDKWAKEYGGIFTVKLGWTTAVILNSFDAIKHTLKDQGDKFVDRPYLPIVELGFTRGGVVFENGPAWSERRRWMFGVLRNFGLGKKSLESRINLEADYLCQEMNNSNSFNPLHCVNNAVSNIICSISFGDRFEYTDPKFKELLDAVRYLFKHTTFVAPVNAIPLLFHTPMYNHFREVTSSLTEFIHDNIQQHEETFDAGNIRDVIDACLVELEKKEHVDSKLFSKDTLWRTIIDLFIAGSETTATTIMWMILYLVKYPEVQRKLQQEVDEVLGQEKKPKWDDREMLPYLEATIMEVQRLSNVIPLFARSTSEVVKINGYKILPGLTILVNLWNVHHDPNQWERPFNFEPERFLSDDKMTIGKPDAFLPFGAGRRVCIGELLSKMEIFLFTANLIQRFTFKVPDDKPTPSVNECVPGLTRSPKPYEIYAIKR